MKRIFPVCWFSILAIATVTMLISSRSDPEISVAMMLAIPLAMAAIGYLIMRQLVFGLVDEVWDTGDSLIIKNGATEGSHPVLLDHRRGFPEARTTLARLLHESPR